MIDEQRNDGPSSAPGYLAQSNKSGTMLRGAESVLCVQLPLRGASLLVPYACVAEIVNRSWTGGSTGDMVEELEWRGVRIPVILLERACGWTLEEPQGRVRLAVLYGLRDKAHMPYYAIVLDGAPRTVRVQSEQLEDKDVSGCPLLGQGVMLDGKPYFIPNLEGIEEWLEGARLRRC